MDIKYNLAEVLALVGKATTDGVSDKAIQGIAALDEAQPGDLSFLGNKKIYARG